MLLHLHLFPDATYMKMLLVKAMNVNRCLILMLRMMKSTTEMMKSTGLLLNWILMAPNVCHRNNSR